MWTMKNQPGTMKNHIEPWKPRNANLEQEKKLKNQPENMKNHE